MDEAELVRRCRAGEREAQRELYEHSVDRVYRLLRRMTGNDADAADLVQDAYVQVFTRLGQFRGDCSLATWIYRVAVNLALALQRSRRSEAAHQREWTAGARSGPRHAAPPYRGLDVRAALERLDDADRMILLLRYDEGLDYREIAQVLQCAAGTVASHLNRARGRLRDQLGPAYAPREETDRRVHQNSAGLPDPPCPPPQPEGDAAPARADPVSARRERP